MRLNGKRVWRDVVRRIPAVTAWPLVFVILTQTAVGGFSVYTLSTIRAYVTNEGIWSEGEHEAVYALTLYLDTGHQAYLGAFRKALAVPLAYRRARTELEMPAPDIGRAEADLRAAGASAGDVPSLIWLFRNFRGFPYLEASISRWKETDAAIAELQHLGGMIEASGPNDDAKIDRAKLQNIDADITPRALAFNKALDEGAHFVERFLLFANLAFALILASLTIWRVGRNLAHRLKFESELAWQATHDALTGLPNRRAFEDRLAKIVEDSAFDPQMTMAILFIDLDQFKIVNDTCGHAAGDALLLRICAPLQAAMRSDDLLVRFGGDEFSVLLPGIEREAAIQIAEDIRAAIERIGFTWKGRALNITASVGVIHEVLSQCSIEDMMSRADMACFMAKEKGRNRVQSHSNEDQDLLVRFREMNWVQRIHEALNDNRMRLYAQEIVPLRTIEDGAHIEILVRMLDEHGALVPPSSFLPAAERFGLMRLIDRWVVEATFRTLAQRSRLANQVPITSCGINLSGATIGDKAFLDYLKKEFRNFGIDPKTICFEVTETSAIQNLEAALEFVSELRSLGCTFALDDFGSGMSSFSYLKDLPVDFLKIDGSFVKNILTERADRAMVEMVGHVGHIMGKRIVAEFVESDALADALREIGIDYGQGFGLARPMPFSASFEIKTPCVPRARNQQTRWRA